MVDTIFTDSLLSQIKLLLRFSFSNINVVLFMFSMVLKYFSYSRAMRRNPHHLVLRIN